MIQLKRPLILASQSKRRQELLALLQLPFQVDVQHIEEPSYVEGECPLAYVERLAAWKSKGVASRHRDALVIGADTVVVADGRVLGKPKTTSDAKQFLQALRQRTHEVHTGVALWIDGKVHTFVETTKVTFRALDDEWIDAYVSTEEPYDKAGAYGIQSYGSLFIEKIEGDYFNVVGLPISRLMYELRALREVEYV